MKHFECQRQKVWLALMEINPNLAEPLYRGIGKDSDYYQQGILPPREGCFSVGKGVFFTNNLNYALDFAKSALLVTDRKIIDPFQEAVDTRKKSYDEYARKKLDMEIGPGNYDGYRLWEEIQKRDTLTYEGGPEDSYVYSRRMPVTQEELVAEIILI